MKSRILLAAALLAAPLASAADGPLKEKALAISKDYKDSVLFLSAVVELEVTAGDNPAKKEERKIEMLGTVLNKDGLIVVPNSTLDVASSVDGRMVNTQNGPIKLSAKATTKEVKILMPDGTEVPAKVSFKDADLDLAFIRPEKPADAKLTPIDSASNAPLALLDDVIVVAVPRQGLGGVLAVLLAIAVPRDLDLVVILVRGLFGHQGFTVRHRDLVVVRVNLVEGEEAVAVAAVLDEGRL
jgi:S1-C subfamily serine protease